MGSQFIALLVVLTLSTATIYIFRDPMSKYMGKDVYFRRCSGWIGITVIAFLSPTFWVYVVLAIAIIIYMMRGEKNPPALYLLLLIATPPVGFLIPGFGIINHFFSLDHFRLLALACLLPAAVRLLNLRGESERGLTERAVNRFEISDVMILLYGLFQVLITMPSESPTSVVRRIFLLVTDLGIPYYVFSRGLGDLRKLKDSMAALALGLLIIAPVSVFEIIKGWLLYNGIDAQWGALGQSGYLRRDGLLRAQASAGHAIVLGNAMAIALIFWLFLQRELKSKWYSIGIGVTLALGMVVTVSRGPWLGALISLLVYISLVPIRKRTFSRLTLTAIPILLTLILSPIGERALEYLPFIGSVDAGSESYRLRLAEISWQLIKEHPIFGTPGFLKYMEELRTGEGIIDLVNGYATIGLSFGLIGLGAYLGIFIGAMWKSTSVVLRMRARNDNNLYLGAALISSLIGSMATLATVSNYLSIPYYLIILASLNIAFYRIFQKENSVIDRDFSAPDRAVVR